MPLNILRTKEVQKRKCAYIKFLYEKCNKKPQCKTYYHLLGECKDKKFIFK